MPIVKTVSVRISTDGAEDAKLKIDRVSARADELGRLDPTIKVQVDTAAASVKLAILRAELKRTAAITGFQGTPAGGGGSGGSGGGFGGGWIGMITSGLQKIISLGPAAIPILGAIGAALVIIIGYLGSLVSEIGAAGIGLAAFGVFAVPTFMKIVGGVQAVSAALDKLNTDKLVNGITKAQLSADRLAQSKAWAAIPKALQPAVKAGLDLKGVFDKLVAAMRPQAVKVFGDALKVIRDLLPLLLPIAMAAGKAIDGLLKGFDRFVKSAGFKSFLAQMQQISGPAITAIGQGLGQVAIALGQFLQVAASPQGIYVLVGAFKLIAGAIKIITFSVRLGQIALTGLVSGMASAGIFVIGVARRIADGFLAMVSAIARVGSLVPGFGWLKGIADAADKAKSHVDQTLFGIQGSLARFRANVQNSTTVFHMQGNIIDLQNKVAAARVLLRNPDLTKTRRAHIEANIDQLLARIAIAKAALLSIQNRTVYINYATTGSPTGSHYGHPLAAGGPAAGLSLVGEQGPELLYTPPGSYVYNASQSRQMLAAGGGGDVYNVSVYASPLASPSDVGRAVVGALQAYNKSTGPIRLKIRS